MDSRFIIFTDLDGTLLDHDTYDWSAARPAMERLRQRRIPWIFVTSKTRAETEIWRERTANRHPFIVENGGALFVPGGYFSTATPGALVRGAYEVLAWGVPYERLIAELRQASGASGCRVLGFHDMTTEEIASACELPADLAALAKHREYDEPFVVLDTERVSDLVAAIVRRGLRCTRGGRFWHITGPNDKGAAVRALAELYKDDRGGPITSVGLGDGINDASLLQQVSIPVIVRSAQYEQLLSMVPGATVTKDRGPSGWAEALVRILDSQSPVSP